MRQMIQADLEGEPAEVEQYNAHIKLAEGEGDHGTRQMLEEILLDEEEHADRLSRYLARQRLSIEAVTAI